MTTPPADFRKSGVERTNPSVYPLGRRGLTAEREIAAMEPVAASAYSKGTSGSTTQIRYCARLLQQAPQYLNYVVACSDPQIDKLGVGGFEPSTAH